MYTRINQDCSAGFGDPPEGLNLWQRLNIPYAWQNGEILQVTADLYDLFIVQYEMKSTEPAIEVKSVKVRGNYNSTHIIVRLVGDCHYQPLKPAELASEFSFPLITRKSTQGSKFVPPSGTRGSSDLNHPWRTTYSRKGVSEQLARTITPMFGEMTPVEFAIVTGYNDPQTSTLDANLFEEGRSIIREKWTKKKLADFGHRGSVRDRSRFTIADPAVLTSPPQPSTSSPSTASVSLPSTGGPSTGHPAIPVLSLDSSSSAGSAIPGLDLANAGAVAPPPTPVAGPDRRRSSTRALVTARAMRRSRADS